jgi:hypothetical protein
MFMANHVRIRFRKQLFQFRVCKKRAIATKFRPIHLSAIFYVFNNGIKKHKHKNLLVMARARPKAETNSQYYRVKHLVHYIDLTPFIRNNTHDYVGRGLEMNGEKLAVKHTLQKLAHTAD